MREKTNKIEITERYKQMNTHVLKITINKRQVLKKVNGGSKMPAVDEYGVAPFVVLRHRDCSGLRLGEYTSFRGVIDSIEGDYSR